MLWLSIELFQPWKARLAESEERAQAVVAMFVIMQADYKMVREEGEAKEKLLTIDLKKMEIYDAIQKKLKLDLKRAPCSGLVGTKILAKEQGDVSARVGRCWKAYAVRKGERELRERVLREVQEIRSPRGCEGGTDALIFVPNKQDSWTRCLSVVSVLSPACTVLLLLKYCSNIV